MLLRSPRPNEFIQIKARMRGDKEFRQRGPGDGGEKLPFVIPPGSRQCGEDHRPVVPITNDARFAKTQVSHSDCLFSDPHPVKAAMDEK